jgi:hypothetical protein
MKVAEHLLLDLIYGELVHLEDKEDGKDVIILYDSELIPRITYFIGSRNLVIRSKDMREFTEIIPSDNPRLVELFNSWFNKVHQDKFTFKGIKLLTLR